MNERPSAIPVTGDPEEIAAELVEAVGPAAAVKVAKAVLALVGQIHRFSP